MRVLRKGNPEAKIKLLFCHGFGSNCGDLADLANFFDPELNFDWHFPQAPFSLPYPGSFAWFPKTAEAQEAALFGDYFHQLENLEDPALEESLDLLKGYILSVQTTDSKWIFGGFSQGTMVTSHLILKKLVRCEALVLFSGAAFAKKSLEEGLELIKENEKRPVFISHGLHDPVLPYGLGLSFSQVFREAGFRVNFNNFEGGHEIPIRIAEKAKLFLENFFNEGLQG